MKWVYDRCPALLRLLQRADEHKKSAGVRWDPLLHLVAQFGNAEGQNMKAGKRLSVCIFHFSMVLLFRSNFDRTSAAVIWYKRSKLELVTLSLCFVSVECRLHTQPQHVNLDTDAWQVARVDWATALFLKLPLRFTRRSDVMNFVRYPVGADPLGLGFSVWICCSCVYLYSWNLRCVL